MMQERYEVDWTEVIANVVFNAGIQLLQALSATFPK